MKTPQVKVLTQPKGNAYPPGRMLVATPQLVAQVVAAIPRGAVLRLGDLRDHLAGCFTADYTCPMTTGMFLRQAAASDVALPCWRVVRDDGSLFDKLPGGVEASLEKLAIEGVKCVPKGRKGAVVADLAALAWCPGFTNGRSPGEAAPA